MQRPDYRRSVILGARRRALLQELRGARVPVHLYAPAGYGKSTFAQMLREQDAHAVLREKRCLRARERSDAVVIGDVELAFDAEEISRVLAPIKLSRASLARVCEVSKGWPVGVLYCLRLAHLGVLERALDDLGDPAFDDLYEYIEHNVFLPASRSQCLALLLGENRFCELPLIRGAIEARHAGELQAVRLHRARSAARRSAYVQAARYFMAAGNAGEAAGCLAKCTAAQRDDALAASLPFESLRHHPDLWLNSCDIRLEQIGAEAFASEAAAIAAILEATPDGAAHARRLREKLAAPIAARSGEPEHITDRAAEGRLRIELFDGKAVLGERNVQLTQREEAVLFTLAAARGRALDAQRLAKTIWPELDAAQGRAALKVAVSRLRARLENTAFVRFKDGKYMLDQAAAVDLEDVARALAAYERTGDAREIAALEPLLAAYRPARLRDALWFAGIESELVRCSHRLAEHFAQIAIARRDPRALRHVGNALLAADACDEEGCKFIVHSHLLEGRADVARSEYDRFAERLRMELGCEPSFSFDPVPRPEYA